MELSYKSCLARLFFSSGVELSCKGRLAKLCLNPLHGTLGHKLPCDAILLGFASNRLTKMSFSWSFCMELSCKSCLAKLFPEFLHGAVVQKLLHEATCLAFAWNYAKASFQSYFSSFYVELSCKSCLSKLIVKLWFGIVEQKLTCKPFSQVEMLNSISRMLRCALK